MGASDGKKAQKKIKAFARKIRLLINGILKKIKTCQAVKVSFACAMLSLMLEYLEVRDYTSIYNCALFTSYF